MDKLNVSIEFIVRNSSCYWYAKAYRGDSVEYDAVGPDALAAMIILAEGLCEEIDKYADGTYSVGG